MIVSFVIPPAVETIRANAHFNNLVLEGGGVKGIAYVGALKALETKGELSFIRRVGGSSAGGITALLVALGYTPDEIEREMNKMDFERFQDSGAKYWSSFTKNKKIRDHFFKAESLMRAFRKKRVGLYKGEEILDWARAKITEKLGPDATFADLQAHAKIEPAKFKELMLTATKISGQGGNVLQYFDAETTGNVKIADALRATMSFPGAFESYDVSINGVSSTYVDGGLCNNFPMEYYDNKKFLVEGTQLNDMGINPYTLGLRVDTREEIDTFKHGNGVPKEGQKNPAHEFVGFIRSMAEAVLSDRDKVHHKYYANTIQIYDANVKTLNFHLSDTEKMNLVTNGRDAVQDWYKLYRGDDIFWGTKKNQTTTEKYRSLSNATLKRQYAELEEELNATDVTDEIRANLVRKQNAIKAIRPELFNKDVKEQVLEDMNLLLNANIQYANESQAALRAGSVELEKILEGSKNVLEAQMAIVAFLRSVQTEPDHAVYKVLNRYFDEVTSIQQYVNDELSRFDKLKREMPLQCESQEEFNANLKLQFERQRRTLLLKAKTELREAGLTEEYGSFVTHSINVQLEKAYTGKLYPTLVGQSYFDRCLEAMEAENNIVGEKIEKLKIKQNECVSQLQKNQKRLDKLHADKQRCGADFNSMFELSGKLKIFIDDQDSLGLNIQKVGRKALKVVFSPVYLPYLAVKKMSTSVFKSKVQRWKDFENRFVSDRELHREEAKRLRVKVQTGLKNWNKEYPKENLNRYIVVLEEMATHLHISRDSNRSGVLLGYIVRSELSKARMIREHRELIETQMGVLEKEAFSDQTPQAEVREQKIQWLRAEREARKVLLSERFTKDLEEILLPFNLKLEQLEEKQLLNERPKATQKPRVDI